MVNFSNYQSLSPCGLELINLHFDDNGKNILSLLLYTVEFGRLNYKNSRCNPQGGGGGSPGELATGYMGLKFLKKVTYVSFAFVNNIFWTEKETMILKHCRFFRIGKKIVKKICHD